MDNTVKAARLLGLIGWSIIIINSLIFGAMITVHVLANTTEELNDSRLWIIMGSVIGFGLVFLITAKNLHLKKTWAKYLTFFLSIVALFVFPVGTLVGGFVLFYLIRGWSGKQKTSERRDLDSVKFSESKPNNAIENILSEFEETPHELVVDWREEDENLIYASQELLSYLKLPKLDFQWFNYDGNSNFVGKFALNYKDRELVVELPHTNTRYMVLRALNEILKSDIEFRTIRDTLDDDTHIIIGHTSQYWEDLNSNEPEKCKALFANLEEPIGFE